MAHLVELTAPRRVAIRTFTLPEPQQGEVRVATWYSGISAGTELATYRGTNPYLDKRWDAETAQFLPEPAPQPYPVDRWGYSEVGVVEAVGPGVTALSPGDAVWGIWGHRSAAVLPATAVAGHRVPAALDPVLATFARVGAVALNSVLTSQAAVGESVAVFGQGVIGLLTTQLLLAQGSNVLAVDMLADRLQLAERFGAVPVPAAEADLLGRLRAASAGPGPDRVIELTGTYPALAEAIRAAGPDGEVIAAGFYQGGAAALALGEEFHHNRVQVTASQIGSVPRHLRRRWTTARLHETAVALIAAGRMDPAPLITHVLPAVDAAAAYELVDRPPPGLLQVVLDFTQEGR